MIEEPKLKVIGHILITDVGTGEILVDKSNSINFENMSLSIAQSLGHKQDGFFYSMRFGNGASTVSGTGVVTYLSPNTVGSGSDLYNSTYEKIIDNLNVSNLDPTRNKIEVSHVAGNLFSDIIVSCVLNTGEPSGQNSLDNTTNIDSTYVFDEIGIVNYSGKLLTHVIFSPVEKSINRVISIVYNIRCQLV